MLGIPCYVCGKLVVVNVPAPMPTICDRCFQLKSLLDEAMPYYDSDYFGDWTMPKLMKRIVEICDG